MPRVVPSSWMPNVRMERIHLHWTAGGHSANSVDKGAYHILVEGSGDLVRGDRSIADNARPITGAYAAHTRKANSGAIGVSLCCMRDARESPFDAGPSPMTETQWLKAMEVIADLAEKYAIIVTPTNILTHAEVWPNLNVPQKNKWDITRLAFDSSVKGHRDVGELMRASVAALLGEDDHDTEDEMPEDMKPPRFRVSGVSPSKLNFRRSPGGDKVGSLPERTIVERLGIDGEWWRVRTRMGYVGYVHSAFLAPVNPS